MNDLLEQPSDIADDGFTERVMRALPQRRVARTPILMGFAAAGCAATFALTGSLVTLVPVSFAMILLVAMSLAMLEE
jgi:hypothetical protein